MEDLDLLCDTLCEQFFALYKPPLIWSDIALCDSTGQEKQSIHAIITPYSVQGNLEARHFAETVTKALPPNIAALIDLGIYKSATGLRLPYCRKVNSDRVKFLPPNNDFSSVLITACYGLTQLPSAAPVPEAKAAVQIDDSGHPG